MSSIYLVPVVVITNSLLFRLRDGPLENLSVGRAKYKKIFAQGKIKWKIIRARQLILRNIHATAEEKFMQGIW